MSTQSNPTELSGTTHRRHLFIVRIWQQTEGTNPEWRGSVEHVPSGQRIYFLSLKDLNDFILEQLSSSLAVQ